MKLLVAIQVATTFILFRCGAIVGGGGSGTPTASPTATPSVEQPTDTIWIGGNILTLNGVACRGLAYKTGDAWTCVDPGALGGSNGVSVVKQLGSAIYIGGRISGTPPIAKFQGGSISTVGSNSSILGSLVSDIALGIDGSTIFAAGWATNPVVAKFDGTTWVDLKMTSVAFVRGILQSKSGDLLAAIGSSGGGSGSGTYGVKKYNSSTWSDMAVTNSSVNCIASDSAGNIYIAGDFTTVGGVSTGRVAKWDGSNWTAVGNIASGTVNTMAFDKSGTLYIGGVSLGAGNIQYYSAGEWKPLALVPNDSVLTINFDSNGILYAGGIFSLAGTVSTTGNASWDGKNWTAGAVLGKNIVFSVAAQHR